MLIPFIWKQRRADLVNLAEFQRIHYLTASDAVRMGLRRMLTQLHREEGLVIGTGAGTYVKRTSVRLDPDHVAAYREIKAATGATANDIFASAAIWALDGLDFMD